MTRSHAPLRNQGGLNRLKWALLGATAITLVACGKANEDAFAYNDVNECVAAGNYDRATCQSEFDHAQGLHESVAPKYQNSTECQSDFGEERCYQRRSSSGGMIWLPFMAGYMLAPRGSSRVATQPLYRPRNDSNNYYTAGSSRIGTVGAAGATQVSRTQAQQPAARARTISRGGFGARATSTGRGRGAGS